MPTTASGTISNNNVAITPTQTVQSKMERYSFFTLSKFFAPILYPIMGWQPRTMPTTILITTVKTLLSIPITAIGISTPYFDVAPYFASIILQTNEMTTIVICVISDDMPSLNASPYIFKRGTKLLIVNLKVFVRNR